DRREIALRLEEEGFDRRRFDVVGAPEVVVTAGPGSARGAGPSERAKRAGGTLRDAAAGWVRASLARRLSCDPAVLDVRVAGNVRGEVPAGRAEDLDAEVHWPTGRVRLGRQRVRLTLRRGGGQVGRLEFFVETAARLRVLVASRNIARGELVTPEDASASELRLTDLGAEYVTDPAALRGICARTEIRAGQPLTGRSITKQSLVRRGEPVTIVCRVGAVTATERGIAKSDGGLGDVIAVERSGRRTPLSARVTGVGEVRVD
ncbi:MAG: flagellar basal body P-ring formation chaperone FlgA, partial [Planctomycetota bacterium]